MDTKTTTRAIENGDSISEKRRKLLKTAAASAPVIATLQSGAAFANTSAFQCINDAKNTAATLPEVVADPVPPSDNWVRKTVKRYRYQKTKKNGKIKITDWWYDVDGNHDGFDPEGPFYRIKKGKVKSKIFNKNKHKWNEYDSETVNVIVYYEPNSDHTNVTEMGVYPKFHVAQPYDTPLPINGSCLASMA